MTHSSHPVALVTGAAKGLGSAIAVHLAQQGYVVVVHYRGSEKEAARTLSEVVALSPESSMLPADITNQAEVQKMIRLIVHRYGRLDVVVHTVGGFLYRRLAETRVEEWQEVMNTNLQSMFVLTQQVLPIMQKQRYGRIVLFGCAGADRMITKLHTTPYYIAKTGVVMLAKQLAAEYAPEGITVNCISPGVLESSVADAHTPIDRKVPFTPVLNTISLLLGQENEYINGANIEIADGWLV